jgi:hypothetical protein
MKAAGQNAKSPFPGLAALSVGDKPLLFARKQHSSRHAFIRGPIPLNWIARAAKLGAPALRVALALWYQKGLLGGRTVKLTTKCVNRFGVGPRAKLRALKTLEKARLISVLRRPGANPHVTIVDPWLTR